jgi:hypothetical protein
VCAHDLETLGGYYKYTVLSVCAGRKYATSLYTIFKLGDAFAMTASEQWFAFVSEVVISIIYGALAGVMSTLMMAGSVGEQEYLVKLAQLKAWMKAKHMPLAERSQVMAFFSANHQSATFYDERSILSFLPLSVSRDLSVHLYGTVLRETPLFAAVGDALLLALCQAMEPCGFQTEQVVYVRTALQHSTYQCLMDGGLLACGVAGGR